jgi:hypothetical protein
MTEMCGECPRVLSVLYNTVLHLECRFNAPARIGRGGRVLAWLASCGFSAACKKGEGMLVGQLSALW